MSEVDKILSELNGHLKKYGLTELRLVEPKLCKGQKKNARYFAPETFKLLVDNIKRDGRLESMPLCYQDGDVYRIISGHHRVEAAKEAGLEKILIMVINPENQDEIISKQLSHNALVGKDDEMILKELFDSIKDIEHKMSTGLSSAIDKINYTSLNFKVGEFKNFTVLFLPEDEGLYDETIELIEKSGVIGGKDTVRLTSIKYFDKFAQAIRKIKKCENIKSNGTAFMRLVDLASQMMESNGDT